MTAKSYDFVVAGGGIVGLSAACALAKRGVRCIVFDRGRCGGEASFAAGGILSPQAETRPDSPLLPLALQALRYHVGLADELLSLTGIGVEHQRSGVLSLAFDDAEEEALTNLTAAQRKLGLRADMLPQDEVRRLGPAAHPQAQSAALFPDDHRVDNRRLLDALKSLARSLGVVLTEYTPLRSIEVKDGRVVAVRTDTERVETGALINALGAWAGQLDGAPGPPVHPVKGHMMSLVEGPRLHHVVYGRHGYMVPRSDGRLIVGSTMEEAGFDTRVTVDGIGRLIEIARAISPQAGNATIGDAWTGLRPATPDGLPIIGPGSVQGLIVAGGLFRNGSLLGPLVGEIAAALALGENPTADLSAFPPDRF